MTFPRKLLYNDEQIVIDRHPHWITLAPRALGLVAAMAFGIFVKWGIDSTAGWTTPLRWIAAALIAGFLVAFLLRLIEWQSRNFVVTTERCIYRNGVLRKSGIEIPLDRINTVFFNQSFMERLVKAGDLGIEAAGENSRQEFSDILDPQSVQNEIYRQMEAYENRRQDRLGQVVRGDGPVAAKSPAEQIADLAGLRDQGHITPEEYEAKKAELLDRM